MDIKVRFLETRSTFLKERKINQEKTAFLKTLEKMKG